MKNKQSILYCLFCIFLWTGCAGQTEATVTDMASNSISPETEYTISETEHDTFKATPKTSVTCSEPSVTRSEPSETISASPETLRFVDVFGEEYETLINPSVEKHPYQPDLFLYKEGRLSYTGDADYTYRLGIDVSHHQDNIDWEKVKADGYEFAFIRLGYRGYGKEGRISLDNRFFENIEAAQKADIETGIYFFSQAVNEEEAKEEAEFVIKNLDGYKLSLPVVYDPENILDDDARTDSISGEQFTKNTIAFCEMISAAGYKPMIYSNMLWEAYQLDLEQLADYPVWYADYEPLPQTPYHFEFWQYSNTGHVDGICGDVDLNIQLIKLSDEN